MYFRIITNKLVKYITGPQLSFRIIINHCMMDTDFEKPSVILNNNR